ncbi:glycosyltransferase family 4 protein [Anaerocellum danielii]|uniref:glycosyltransferase family 4 protein n=2 Tax=Anaerocellum danielii TaxID=1387557 RepID=UPI001427D64D|nr:glycosyltransferase family 4 protein [Caldicellulosiruptor danielii]
MKCLIFQRFIPFYREEFFKRIQIELKKKNIEVFFAFGETKQQVGRTGKKFNSVELENKIYCPYVEISLFNRNIRLNKRVISVIFKIKPDVVIFEGIVSNISNWVIVLLSKVLKIKIVAWVLGWEGKRSFTRRLLLKVLYKNVDVFFAYNTSSKKYLNKLGVRDDKIVVLYNTINEHNILKNIEKIKQQAGEIKKKMNLGERIVLLYCGAVIREKKIEILLDSMKKLSDCILIIVGDGNDMYYYKKYATDKKLDNVIFVGRVIENVDCYYQVADIFIMPCQGGLALNQAMIHQKPIICGKADGSEYDLVINGYNGFRDENLTPDKIVTYVEEIKKIGIEKMGKNSLSILFEKEILFEKFVERFVKGIININILGE